MKDDDFSLQESDELNDNSHRYFQVDILKAAMIFLVVFDHTYPWALKDYMGVALWERISIPVFLVILGFNMGLSLKRTGETSLRKLYSWKYFKTKFWRYIFPFLILYTISTIIGLIIYDFNLELMWYGQHYDTLYGIWRWDVAHLLIGILPFYGPGNWFLPVVFWAILIMPLLYKGFSGRLVWAIIALINCFLIELIIQLDIYDIFYPFSFATWEEYYNFRFYYSFIVTSPFFMLSAIGLGMWFSRNPNIFAKQNIFMWILFPLSFVYLIANQFFGFRFDFIRGDYHLFVFPYSAFLFLVIMNLIPKKLNNNILVKGIRTLSSSTYHILLTQIFYFGIVISIWGHHYGASIVGINSNYDPNVVFLYVLLNWVICLPIGSLWWFGETKLRDYRLKRKNARNLGLIDKLVE